MRQRVERKVNIQIGPVQMAAVQEFHVQNLSDRRISEPWKTVMRKKILPIVDKEPDSVLIDVADLN
jgi:hypothetical protein